VQEIWLTCGCTLLPVDPAVIWNNTVLTLPLKAAETTIQPEADDRAVAEKAALLEPWGTVIVSGIESPALLLERPTTTLPAATLDMVIVHTLLEPAGILVGTQANEEKAGVGRRVKLTLWDDAPSVAVMVALWLLPMAAVVALKAAEVAPAATVTDAGTVSTVLVLVRVTVEPPAGAAWVSVTVQVLEEFGPRLVGLQTSEVEPPPLNAITVADQMSDTLRVAVASVVRVEAATRSPDSTQLEKPHWWTPLPDISRFV
jgi:hypothetical protein